MPDKAMFNPRPHRRNYPRMGRALPQPTDLELFVAALLRQAGGWNGFVTGPVLRSWVEDAMRQVAEIRARTQ